MKVKIEDAYSDGHEAERIIEIAGPEPDPDTLDDEIERTNSQGETSVWSWWDAEVFPHTGDGHGLPESHGGPRTLDSWHDAIITEANNPELVGEATSWGY